MMKDIYVYTPLDIRNTVSRVLKDVSDYVTEEYAFATDKNAVSPCHGNVLFSHHRNAGKPQVKT